MVDNSILPEPPAREPAPAGQARVSVILPTFNEASNLPLIVPEIASALSAEAISFEILVVDDASTDGTPQAAEILARSYPLRLIERQERGLATAVIRGFNEARGTVCVVMDADGSHCPNDLPALTSKVGEQNQIVVGSRHLPGGGFRNGSLRSRWVSKFAALFARGLTPLSDPTTGFMAVSKELVDRLDLDPVGWKIVLEVVVKAHPRSFAEIPIVFDNRRTGYSKQSLSVFKEYLTHCWRLRQHRRMEKS